MVLELLIIIYKKKNLNLDVTAYTQNLTAKV